MANVLSPYFHLKNACHPGTRGFWDTKPFLLQAQCSAQCLLFGTLHISFTVPPCSQPVLKAAPLPRPLTPLLLAAQLLSWPHNPQRRPLFFLTVSQVATGAHKMTPVPFSPLPFIAKRVPPFPRLPRPRPVCS